ncbi:hypothetical protein R1sor_021495 [Riccia sorocarpa]|uniref:Uncharacterized protein n=1 Tax=Riccia sorocarpa TaxID=122646 RepID=A0ABD3GJD3_9MARC
MLNLLFPVRLNLMRGPSCKGLDETQNSPAHSDSDNSPESEEEHVPIPENGLPGWIACRRAIQPVGSSEIFPLTSGNTELPVGAEDEPTNLSSGEAPSNQQPTPDKGKAVVEDEPTRLDPNLAAKMEKARVKEATSEELGAGSDFQGLL